MFFTMFDTDHRDLTKGASAFPRMSEYSQREEMRTRSYLVFGSVRGRRVLEVLVEGPGSVNKAVVVVVYVYVALLWAAMVQVRDVEVSVD